MKKISLIMCQDMHMDIERANELLANLLENPEYEVICDYTEADIIIMMTCAFGTGKTDTIWMIADVINNCRENAEIWLTGCLVSTNKKELEALPKVTVKSYEEVKAMFQTSTQYPERCISQNTIIISEGCLKKCAYCVYPMICGKYKSKPIEIILKEVEKMSEMENTIYLSGAQETSDYGIDLYHKREISHLLDEICTKYPNCQYVIGWFHPSGLTDEVLSVIQKHKNIVEIMLHIQHVDEEILKKMNRPSFLSTDEKICKLRKMRPDIAISTEVIVGFPGETNQKFESLLQYLDEREFDDIGVASYDPVVGTEAAKLPGTIPLEVKNQRMEFIKNRYTATVYPAPIPNSSFIIKTYLDAVLELSKIPSMIYTAQMRQKYEHIAGVDTKAKMPMQYQNSFSTGTRELDQMIKQICYEITQARDSWQRKKKKDEYRQVYTEEFRKYMVLIFESSGFKPKLISRAREILID